MHKTEKNMQRNKSTLQDHKTTHPFELVSIDLLHLYRYKGGYEYILVIINHFTQFMQVYATTSKSSKIVENNLFNDFALRFGFPSQIHCVKCGVSPGVKVTVNDSESDHEYCIQVEQ